MKTNEAFTYTGSLLIMRDQAQSRLHALWTQGLPLPVALDGRVVFYAGPARPDAQGRVAIGPTTSARMDRFLEMLFELGVKATIGKGPRSSAGQKTCERYGKPYWIAPSGCAAYLSSCIEKGPLLVCFEDLGPEAIWEVWVKDFPLIQA